MSQSLAPLVEQGLVEYIDDPNDGRARMARDKPGNEIQSPMAEVILGGLLTPTFLNFVVAPVLFARWGADPRSGSLEGDIIE